MGGGGGGGVVAQLCPTLCDPMDYSLPGSSVHGILQARILEWVAISSSRGSSQPRNLALQADSLPPELQGKPLVGWRFPQFGILGKMLYCRPMAQGNLSNRQGNKQAVRGGAIIMNSLHFLGAHQLVIPQQENYWQWALKACISFS